MLVKNVSSRPHWVGNVLIAPTETKEIGDEWANSINAEELIAVAEEKEVKKYKKTKEVVDVVEEAPTETGEATE